VPSDFARAMIIVANIASGISKKASARRDGGLPQRQQILEVHRAPHNILCYSSFTKHRKVISGHPKSRSLPRAALTKAPNRTWCYSVDE